MPEGQFRWLPTLRELDEEQQKVIFSSLNKGVNIIYGPAGCGKTAITLYCAKTLEDTKKNYLIFLYTDALFRFIRSATNDLGIPDDRIQRFYKWIYRLHKEKIGTPPSGDNEIFSLWVDNLNNHFLKNPNDIPKFEFILIDEAQDFKPNVAKLFKMLSDNIFIAGDSAQSLYEGASSTNELIQIWHPVSTKHILVNNYRNPKNIAKVAAIFLDPNILAPDEFLKRVKGRDFEMKPIWEQVTDFSEQTNKVIEIIKQARGSERIGILCRHQQQVFSIAGKLKQSGITVQIALSKIPDYDFYSGTPVITTIHSSKGLEFDWVILPYLNNDIWGISDDVKERKAFFVAVTRAKNRLYLLSTKGKECSFLQEIINKDPNLLQIPRSISTQQSARTFQTTIIDDDPF